MPAGRTCRRSTTYRAPESSDPRIHLFPVPVGRWRRMVHASSRPNVRITRRNQCRRRHRAPSFGSGGITLARNRPRSATGRAGYPTKGRARSKPSPMAEHHVAPDGRAGARKEHSLVMRSYVGSPGPVSGIAARKYHGRSARGEGMVQMSRRIRPAVLRRGRCAPARPFESTTRIRQTAWRRTHSHQTDPTHRRSPKASR